TARSAEGGARLSPVGTAPGWCATLRETFGSWSRPASSDVRAELVRRCRARSVHRTSWVRGYEVAWGRAPAGAGGEARAPGVERPTSGTQPAAELVCPVSNVPPPGRSQPASSYVRAELVACTVRAGYGGTSSRERGGAQPVPRRSYKGTGVSPSSSIAAR